MVVGDQHVEFVRVECCCSASSWFGAWLSTCGLGFVHGVLDVFPVPVFSMVKPPAHSVVLADVIFGLLVSHFG